METFDTESDFGFNPYHDTLQTNLGNPDSLDGGPAPTLSFDATEGSPSPGSLKVTIPFSGPNQYVDVQSLVFVVPQDWSGHTLRVRLKVDEGSSFRGVAQILRRHRRQLRARRQQRERRAGIAVAGALHGFEPSNDDRSERSLQPEAGRAYGLQLNSGSAGVNATPATFHLDSFSLE